MHKKPTVSIISISYNQERYIGEMLQSIVTQITNFEFELIIADDNSQDQTKKIIKEYADKYPDIIKPILRRNNLGPWSNFTDALQGATGTYIALCEGDDYWMDPGKLQKQVDFLEKNSNYSMCFHPVRVFFENQEEEEFVAPKKADKTNFTTLELLKQNFIYTNSVVYRRQDYRNIPSELMPGDWYLHLYHAQFGKIGFINQVMSAYRRHSGGIWWDSYKNIDRIWQKHGLNHLNLYIQMLEMYGKNATYREVINTHIHTILNSLIQTDIKNHTHLTEKSLKNFPQLVEPFVLYQYKTIEDNQGNIHKKDKEIEKIKDDFESNDKVLEQKNQEIKAIKNSKFWKLRNFIAKLVGRETI